MGLAQPSESHCSTKLYPSNCSEHTQLFDRINSEMQGDVAAFGQVILLQSVDEGIQIYICVYIPV